MTPMNTAMPAATADLVSPHRRSDGTPEVKGARDGERFVDGNWWAAADGATLADSDPADGSLVGWAADTTAGEVWDAVAAARTAFDTTTWPTDADFRRRCDLNAHVQTTDSDRPRRIARAVRSGGVATGPSFWVGSDRPFGGYGASGLGSEHGGESPGCLRPRRSPRPAGVPA